MELPLPPFAADWPALSARSRSQIVWCLAAGLVATTLAVVAGAQAVERARAEALTRRASERLLALQEEADRLASEEKTLLGELRALDVQRAIKQVELHQLDAEAAEVEGTLREADQRIIALEARTRAARPELASRFVAMYKLGQAGYVRLILSTADTRRIGQATRTIGVLAQLDRERLASYQKALGELKSTRATLEARQRRLAAVRTEARATQAAAERAAAARQTLIRDIDRRRDLNAQLSGELQAAQQNLDSTVRDLSSSAEAGLPIKPFRGDLDWPVAGTARRRTVEPGSRNAATLGIDISAPEAAPASAIHDGLVAFAGPFAGFGNLVIVDHGALSFSLYGDLLEILVQKGAHVERGQVVGTVGRSPAGPAGLHFEMRVDGQPVDPLQWLKKQ
jgi:septal ring factor EnvC (AmiA/AmiB activator)